MWTFPVAAGIWAALLAADATNAQPSTGGAAGIILALGGLITAGAGGYAIVRSNRTAKKTEDRVDRAETKSGIAAEAALSVTRVYEDAMTRRDHEVERLEREKKGLHEVIADKDRIIADKDQVILDLTIERAHRVGRDT